MNNSEQNKRKLSKPSEQVEYLKSLNGDELFTPIDEIFRDRVNKNGVYSLKNIKKIVIRNSEKIETSNKEVFYVV